MRFSWPLALTLLIVMTTAHAQVYSWRDADGRFHFGNQPGGQAQTKDVPRSAPSEASTPSPDAKDSLAVKAQPEITFYVSRYGCSSCAKAFSYFKDNNLSVNVLRSEGNSINEGRFVALGGQLAGSQFVIVCGKSKLLTWYWDPRDFEEVCLNPDPKRWEVRKIPMGQKWQQSN